jgi:hypothetical protein
MSWAASVSATKARIRLDSRELVSRWAFFSAALFLAACTHSVGRGSDLYYEGRYIEAAHVLEMSEVRMTSAPALEQAVYGLYRGATLLRLGDLEGAERWLAYARQRVQLHPGALSPAQEELLEETSIALHADLDRRAAARGF